MTDDNTNKPATNEPDNDAATSPATGDSPESSAGANENEDKTAPKPNESESERKASSEEEDAIASEETEESASHNGQAPIPPGTRKLRSGTILPTATGNVTLASDALIEFEGPEYSFAGFLSSWHPSNLIRNRDDLKLKYDGNGTLLPLAAQAEAEKMHEFIPTLDAEEAMLLGISADTYKQYCEATFTPKSDDEELADVEAAGEKETEA